MIRLFWTSFVFLWLTIFVACDDQDDEPLASVELHRVVPSHGSAGAVVAISGRGFNARDAFDFYFNGKRATIEKVMSDTLLQVIVPEGVTTGYISVQANGQTVQGPFFVSERNANPPVLIKLSVANAEVGDVFTVEGENFLTGELLTRNIVRVGGVKASVLAGTATALTIVMPPVPSGKKDVTVMALGETSNALTLQATGFSGSLYWAIAPGYEQPGEHFVLRANADGTTVTTERKVYPASRYFNTWSTTPASYNPVSKTFYFGYAPPGKYHEGVVQVSLGWNDFKVIYNGEDPQWSDQGIGFYNVDMLKAMPDDRLYLYGSGYAGYAVFVGGAKDGNAPLQTVGPHPDPSTYFPALQGYNPNLVATDEKYIYGMLGVYDPILGRHEYFIHRLALDGSLAIEKLPTSFTEDVVNIIYNRYDDALYVAAGSGNTAKLWKVNLSSGETTLITDTFPKTARDLCFVNTSTGVKLYWLASSPAGLNAIWMLNLKPNTSRMPIMLYESLEVVPGYPEALNYSIIPFFFADEG